MNTKLFPIIALSGLLLLNACSPQAMLREAPVETVQVEMGFPGAIEAPVEMEVPAAPTSFESAEGQILATPAPGDEGDAFPVSQDTTFSLPSTTDRMIIKDAYMALLVENTDLAIERVTSLVADQGGYLISARSWLENEFKYAEIRMGVPSSNFENTLNYLRKMGIKVLDENLSGQDVSAEYTDLKSRLGNLEATAARVRAFLDEAKTVEESLRVNQTLSELEGQIEQIKGQMKYYEGRAAYSTITLTINPQIPTPTPTPTPTPGPGWNPSKTVKDASEVLVEALKAAVDAFIWILFCGWPFVLIGIVVWLVVKRLKKRSSKSEKENNQD